MATAIDWTPKARAVLETASELFYEHGITAVGVDLIAARAGVTKKTLYDRFGSKERLVAEYLADRDAQWRALLSSAMTQAEPDPRAQVAALFDAAAAWSRDRGGRGCAMINAHAEISDPAHQASAVIDEQKRWMLELFTELARSAQVPDPREVGDQLMLLHEGAIVMTGLHGIDDAFARASALAVQLLG